MQRARGFTLIEILVVLIIISIVATVATVTISHNQNKRVETVAKELTESLTLAEEQAMLQPTVLGLVITDYDFRFDAYQPKGKSPLWQPVKETLLQSHAIPQDVQVIVQNNHPESSQTDNSEANDTPQITISSTGEITPFILYVGEKGRKPRYKITGDADGAIQLIAI